MVGTEAMSRLVCIVLCLFPAALCAQELAVVCYNYGCSARAEVRLSEVQLEEVHGLLNGSAGGESERAAIAEAVGWMYRLAGEQTPIWRDKAGNLADDLVDGRMDCIDHSTNTHAWLTLFSRRGWLRFHDVLEPARRGMIFTHWAGRIRDTESGRQYAVDSWFHDHGHAAEMFALEDWMAGARANGVYW